MPPWAKMREEDERVEKQLIRCLKQQQEVRRCCFCPPWLREGSPGRSRRHTQPGLAAPLSSGSAGLWGQTHLWWTLCSPLQWQTEKRKKENVNNVSTSPVLLLLSLMIISSSGGFESMNVRGGKMCWLYQHVNVQHEQPEHHYVKIYRGKIKP